MKTYTEEQMKLASKHIQPSYLVAKQAPHKHGGVNNHRTTVYRVFDEFGPYQTIADVFGDGAEQCLATANLLSAAPEAIEFISDLLDVLDSPDPHKVFEMKLRGEEILKKAYNL